jgi:hypothetical protein
MPSYFTLNQTNGVKYIKVATIDANGNDQSDYLGQLQNITLSYPDRSGVTYNIAGAQNFGTYFLYSIGPYIPGSLTNFNTSSAGEILDYSFLAISASAFGSLPDSEDADWGDIKLGAFGTVTGNTLGYLTASNATYTFGNTPNINLQVRFSGSYTYAASPGNTLLLGAGISNVRIQNTGEALRSIALTVGPNTFDYTVILSSSANLIENNELVFGMGVLDSTNLTINSVHVSMSLHNSSLFDGSSSLTALNPYVPNFDYNEYNVLLNNVDISRKSIYFMDVDYSQNPVTPVNQSLILSESADRAYVQDSNYTSQAWSTIRYRGSKYTSIKPSI